MRTDRSASSRAGAALARQFGVDTRSLAAFRIAVGALLLTDLASRARHLRAFYTDAGVLPRVALRAHYPTLSGLSLHVVSGAAWVQVALFAVAAAAALALLVGYRTRVAAVVSWLLLVSLHARNPVVLSAGDSILRRLLFWGQFLPLGAQWSVDARRTDRGPPERVLGVASAALLLQVVAVYAVNAVLKFRGDAWLAGDAVGYVFALDAYTLPLGDLLAGFPPLLGILSHAWLALLVASPLLVVLAGRARTLLVAAFVVAHLGMAATMRLGLFPAVSVAALLPFLPGHVWDRVPTPGWSPTATLDRVLPRLTSPSVPENLASAGHSAAVVVAAGALVAVAAWNAAALGYVDTPDGVGDVVDPAEHRWNMFAPEPRQTAVEYAATGELASGERVALFGDSVKALPPPTRASGVRWRTYGYDLRLDEYASLRDEFAGYLCSEWERTHASDLVRVNVAVAERTVDLDGSDATQRRDLAATSCPDSGVSSGAERAIATSMHDTSELRRTRWN